MTIPVFILGFACILFAVYVMEEARKFRAPAMHIWLVAGSYIVLIGLAMNVADEQIEQVWAIFAFLLGIGSLITMLRHYRKVRR
ncbi:MAG: hypothetical protein H0U59_04265 [Gemmatimonadaceae bacterium]|nr:hypothetical protein [Gemmatimonadaceae bacterium]